MVDNTAIFEGLTQDQEKAILALLNNKTVREAATEAEMGETTLYRWLKQDQFKKAYNEAKSEMFGQALIRLQKGVNEAIQTLEDIHRDKESPASARVTAARTVIETAIKARDQEDIINRLNEIEEIISKNRGGKG